MSTRTCCCSRSWKAYGIYVAISQGQVDHTPALYVINPNGTKRWVAETAMEYRAVDTEAVVLAQVVQRALPQADRPALPPITVPPPPAAKTAIVPAVASGGTIVLAGHGPTLVVFVASWAPGLADQWRSLAAEQRLHPGIRLVLMDIGTVEPHPNTFRKWVARHPDLPSVPVGLDATGRVADALGAENIPEAVLVSGTGQVLFRSQNWPTPSNWATMKSRLGQSGSQP